MNTAHRSLRNVFGLVYNVDEWKGDCLLVFFMKLLATVMRIESAFLVAV